jgi:hypothetical protein
VVAGLAAGIAGGYAAGLLGLNLGNEPVTRISGLPIGLGVGLGTGTVAGSTGAVVGGFLGGLVGAAAGNYGSGPLAAAVNGVGVAVMAGTAVIMTPRERPSRGVRPSAIGPVLALSLAFTGLLWIAAPASRLAAVLAGLCVGVFATVGVGLVAHDADPTASTPYGVLVPDRRMFLTFAGTIGIAIGGITGVMISLVSLSEQDQTTTYVRNGLLVGAGVAIVTGTTLAFVRSAWGFYALTLGWLSLRGRLPTRLMAFLRDAHRRGVLRQVGAHYQFRHVDLQHHLAPPGDADDPPLPA